MIQLWLFATPWTVALQAPLSMGILQARILEWVPMPSSRGSSRPRDRTGVSLRLLHWQAGPLSLVPAGKKVELNNFVMGNRKFPL